MKPRIQAIHLLEENGFEFRRHGANHDIFISRQLGAMIPLKRHDFDEDDLRYIEKELKQLTKTKN